MSRFNVCMLVNNFLSVKNNWSRKATPEKTNHETPQLPGCFTSAAPFSSVTEADCVTPWKGSHLDLPCKKPGMTPLVSAGSCDFHVRNKGIGNCINMFSEFLNVNLEFYY